MAPLPLRAGAVTTALAVQGASVGTQVVLAFVDAAIALFLGRSEVLQIFDCH